MIAVAEDENECSSCGNPLGPVFERQPCPFCGECLCEDCRGDHVVRCGHLGGDGGFL